MICSPSLVQLDSYGYYDVLGETEVFLVDPEGEESNLGDILTDSMAMAWEDTTIAFINDGGIRSSIREGKGGKYQHWNLETSPQNRTAIVKRE